MELCPAWRWPQARLQEVSRMEGGEGRRWKKKEANPILRNQVHGTLDVVHLYTCTVPWVLEGIFFTQVVSSLLPAAAG